MKTILRLGVVLMMVSATMVSHAQVVEAPYQVATWKGFTEAAITYTFDDNTTNQYNTAIPMFNEYGFNATFYPVVNWSPKWDNFRDAVSAGHEIGSHTITHDELDDKTDAEQEAELKNSQDTINNRIGSGYSCLTIAYPYCVPSKDSITREYYIAARHCQGNIEKSTPDDFYNISSIVCGSQGSVNSINTFKAKANEAATTNGWNVYLFHAIDGESGYSPVTSPVLRGSLEYLHYNRDRFWVSTFVNTVRYIRERNAVSVSELELTADTIKIEVTDTLDNTIYNYPVTIGRPLPVTWDYALAYQNGIPLETTVKTIESEEFIVFDVVPDGGDIFIVPAEEPPFSTIIDYPYEVGTWKDFSEAAITYTFDDNSSGHYSDAIPLFNNYGFEATFYPVINWSPNWSTFQNAANAGHEIGSHTISHPHLGDSSVAVQNEELNESQVDINSHITGQSCLTIAYPYCEPSDDTITAKYYIAARNCQGFIEKTTPDDFYNISSILCGEESDSLTTTDDFNKYANAAVDSNGWSVYLVHGIDSDGGYSPISSTVLDESLQYLETHKDSFWVSSFVNVVRYIRERNCVSVEVTDLFNDSILVTVSDTLDDIIYNYPVTVRRTLPSGWETAQVFQDGDSLYTRIRERGAKKYVEFNAVPDGGTVRISKAVIPQEPEDPEYISDKTESGTAIKISPNPFYNDINITAEGQFKYRIYLLDGRIIDEGYGNDSKSVGSGIEKGFYILYIENETEFSINKVIKR